MPAISLISTQASTSFQTHTAGEHKAMDTMETLVLVEFAGGNKTNLYKYKKDKHFDYKQLSFATADISGITNLLSFVIKVQAI
jgi:hypothetical protein